MQEFQNAAYGTGGQLAPQGFFGGLLGAPLGGAIGKGIGGLFGNAGLGNQIGQIAGGIGGTLLPFGTDPVTAAYAQQAQQQQLMQQLQQQQQQQQPGQQLAPQGWFGNLLGQVGQPLGGAIGGLFGQQGVGSTIGGVAGQLGKLLPFGADPVSAAYAQQIQQAQQQQQLAPQGWFGNLIGQVGQPLGGAIGGLFGQQGVGSTIGNVAGQLGKLLPFGADPVSAAYAQQLQQAQQQQLAPQGWFGNLIGQVGQPLGGAIGGLFGQQGAGSAIGNVAGQLGKLLPFGAEPQAFANVQQQMQQQIQQLQQQLIQQQQQHQQQLQQLMAQQQQGQQGQFAPQGWFGNLLGQVGRPLGGAIGSVFGNAGLGSTIGGAAGQIGQMLPFGMDPITAAYAQQAQLAQQQGMPQYSSQQTLH